jgi:hypothetical protein
VCPRPQHLWLALCASFATACADPASGQSSTSAADSIPAPDAAHRPWLWAGEGRTEYRTEYLSDPDAAYPENHPVQQRLQHWLNLAHASLDAAFVPAPAIVLERDQQNQCAHNDSFPVCLPLQAENSPAGGRLLLATDGTLSLDDGACHNSGISLDTTLAILQFLGDESGTCQLLANTDGSLEVGEGCTIAPELMRRIRQLPLGYRAKSRHITICAGTVQKWQGEGLIVYGLFHELGHYYGAHQIISEDKHFNFFFAVDGDRSGPPLPDPKYADLTARAQRALPDRDRNLPELETIAADASAARLGFYLDEQAADEFALSLLRSFGLDSQFAIDSLLALDLRECDNQEDAACRERVEHQCLDDRGEPLFVPWDFGFSHGPPCFRVSNARQWIKRHPYAVRHQVDLLSDEAWRELQQTL